MKTPSKYLLAICLTLLTLSSTTRGKESGETKKVEANSPLLQSWPGPYGGVPPWNLVRPDEFVAAFDAAIEISADEIDAIANNPDPPTFENTIVAMEKAGRTLEPAPVDVLRLCVEPQCGADS